jgi:hypothetical protein
LAYQAGSNVGSTAGGIANNDAHRPRRIGLRSGAPQGGGDGGGTRCQIQKSATRKICCFRPERMQHGSYWKVIMSVRLSVVAFGFKGSFAKFALPEFKTL